VNIIEKQIRFLCQKYVPNIHVLEILVGMEAVEGISNSLIIVLFVVGHYQPQRLTE